MTKYAHSISVFLLFFLCISSFDLFAQKPVKWSSNEIYVAIEKLNNLSSALYVAAHPDDENTRMISYLANEEKAHTTYLSLTRGDGGQNLIGTELGPYLGVLRTQELLAARRVDGGNQMFSRANDFGYSKHPDETLKIWNEQEVLADAVWAIRLLKPDIIINRFDHNSAGRTHGHHTSSAIIGLEAYKMAADPNAFPEQLKHVDTWKAERYFFNTSWWFYGSRENFEKADKSKMIEVDVGNYYPTIGKSNNEIAAESRSKHRCQGFGSIGSRGSQFEYLQLLEGEMPKNGTDLFGGITKDWTRVGAKDISIAIEMILKTFDHSNPSASTKDLVNLYKEIQHIDDPFWKKRKSAELKKIITATMGLFIEVTTDDPSLVKEQKVKLNIEAINRSDINVVIDKIRVLKTEFDTTLNFSLQNNESIKLEKECQLSAAFDFSGPYWLKEKGSLGMYRVDEQTLRGQPESVASITSQIDLNIEGLALSIERPVVYKYRDPSIGELYEPVHVVPNVFININNPVHIFPDVEAQEVEVIVEANTNDVKGDLQFNTGDGWITKPNSIAFTIAKKGAQKIFKVKVYPPESTSTTTLSPRIILNNTAFTFSKKSIAYEHIPKQLVVEHCSTKLVRVNLEKKGERIGYIMGAGDKVPEAIEIMGYQVEQIDLEQFSSYDLSKFDAIVSGIRTYNKIDAITLVQDALMEYVENGGTYIAQYNTNRGLKTADIGPYPFTISRDRVTVEEAEIRIIRPEHKLLMQPNKITAVDFEDWVQERGLYFPNEWDERYTTLFSLNDPGEDPKQGSMLVAEYGEGYFIYSTFSWFRELPAGVPGAYRIFANMLSINQ